MLRNKKRTAAIAASLAGQVVLFTFLHSLPQGWIPVDIYGPEFNYRYINGIMTPSDWQAVHRAKIIAIFICISFILNLVMAFCECSILANNDLYSTLFEWYTSAPFLKSSTLFSLLNAFGWYLFACAPGLALVKYQYIYATYLYLACFVFCFFCLLVRMFYDESRFYDFLRCFELAAVIACFVFAEYYYNNSFALVLIFNCIAFFGLTHFITTCVKRERPYSYIGYYLLSAFYLTLVDVLLNCHSMNFWAHSHSMQKYLTVLGIFLLCSYVCVATFGLFKCYGINLINSKTTYTFACLFVATSSLYINYNLAKNATAEILCYVTFALSSVFCMFFACRLAQEIIFSSYKKTGSGAAGQQGQSQRVFSQSWQRSGMVPNSRSARVQLEIA